MLCKYASGSFIAKYSDPTLNQNVVYIFICTWGSDICICVILLPPPRRLCFSPGFVCEFVCEQDNSKTYGRILMKFSEYV